MLLKIKTLVSLSWSDIIKFCSILFWLRYKSDNFRIYLITLVRLIKGGESSSQFQWFWIFLFYFWGCGCKDIQQIQKDMPKKSFWKLWVLFFPPKPQFSKLLDLLWFWREEQNSEFPKPFMGDIFLHLLNMFATAASKLKQKVWKIIVQFQLL